MSSFVLAHLSDPHLAPLPTPNVFELAGKRLGGFINWHYNRRHFHRQDVLERIVCDLKSRAPDHIAVTGDLINLSLAAEFAPARSWLERLGRPQDVTVVPGNHDTYVWTKARHPQRHWAEYMRGDDTSATELPKFPFVRRRGPAALIGLTTAVPTLPFRATGRLGDKQLARLSGLLDELGRSGTFRVVLLHHPPVTRPDCHDHRLIDGGALVAVLQQHGAELVLHGHEHLDLVRWFEAPQHRVPAVGVPSASGAAGGKYDSAAYNLYSIEGGPGAWRCEMVTRGIAGDGGCIVERKRAVLLGANAEPRTRPW
jgi:3',5'-cyclic AMP phosphodiesterase CpdA